MSKSDILYPIVELETKVKNVKSASKRRGLLNEYNMLCELRSERAKSKLPLSVSKQCQERIKSKMLDLLRNLPRMHYSMGEKMQLSIIGSNGGKLLTVTNDTRTDYANSSKYKAVHGYHHYELTVEEFNKTITIGGIPTILLKQVNKRDKIYKVKWLISKGEKQYFNPIWEHGYISLVNNYHDTTKSAVSDSVKRYRREKRYKRASKKYYNQALNKFYGKQHSLNSGNCEAGTNRFIKLLRIDLNTIGGIRGDLLLKLAEKHGVTSFVQRMIENKAKELA